LTEFRKIL